MYDLKIRCRHILLRRLFFDNHIPATMLNCHARIAHSMMYIWRIGTDAVQFLRLKVFYGISGLFRKYFPRRLRSLIHNRQNYFHCLCCQILLEFQFVVFINTMAWPKLMKMSMYLLKWYLGYHSTIRTSMEDKYDGITDASSFIMNEIKVIFLDGPMSNSVGSRFQWAKAITIFIERGQESAYRNCYTAGWPFFASFLFQCFNTGSVILLWFYRVQKVPDIVMNPRLDIVINCHCLIKNWCLVSNLSPSFWQQKYLTSIY